MFILRLFALSVAGSGILAQGFGPDLSMRGDAAVHSEINFDGRSGFNPVQSFRPPYIVGAGAAFVQASGGTLDCGYDQLVGARTLGLAQYGSLSIEGFVSLVNRGFAVCPTPVSSGALSTAPGTARSFAEPGFNDRLTFSSTTLAVGTSRSVRVVIGFSDGGRIERRTVRDLTSATVRRETNFVVHPSARRAVTLVAYRANGMFASQVSVEESDLNGTYTLPLEVGGKLNVAARLRDSVEAVAPRNGDVIEHQIQYGASLTMTVEPLDPAVTFIAESGASYRVLNVQRLAYLPLTNGQFVLPVPPGQKLQTAQPQPGSNDWNWKDHAEKALLLVNPTNTMELFRTVDP